jgi:glycosyltransferase involved in cell wall biosynthesis
VLNRYARAADILRAVAAGRRGTEVVILHVFGGPSFVVEDAASRLAARLGHRLIGLMAGGGLPDFGARHPGWVRRVLARFDLLVAPSPYLVRWAEGLRLPVDAVVIPDPLRLDGYPYRARSSLEPRLLWMRTFHEIYNPLMAVDVLAALRRSRDARDVTLTMAGQDKGLLDDARRRAAALGLAGAVRFPGFLGPADKRREFAAHDVFLNTNRIDNTPVSVVEAGAFGVPVVATDVGGIADLLRDGENALLVPDGDADAMAAAVDRLLDDPDLAARLSAGGRVLAEERDVEAVADRWEDAIGRVLVGGR